MGVKTVETGVMKVAGRHKARWGGRDRGLWQAGRERRVGGWGDARTGLIRPVVEAKVIRSRLRTGVPGRTGRTNMRPRLFLTLWAWV